jgi:hypothetical protein
MKIKSGEILPHENLRNHNSLIGITVFQLTFNNSCCPLGNTAVDSFSYAKRYFNVPGTCIYTHIRFAVRIFASMDPASATAPSISVVKPTYCLSEREGNRDSVAYGCSVQKSHD